MNKIHRSKFASYFIIFIFFSQIAITAIGVVNLINAINEKNLSWLIISIVMLVVFTIVFILCYFMFNRMGSIIIYDKENKVLLRKGCLFGYKDILRIEDIINVKKITYARDNTYYVLIDNNHSSYSGDSKKSFFSVTCSKESKEFIEQFWDKPLDKFWG